MRIGWIGVGLMGAPMVSRVHAAGHQVQVYSRAGSLPEALIAAGLRRCATLGEVVAGADVVVTMLGTPADVEQVYLGSGNGAAGLLAAARPGTVLVDMTTSGVEQAQRIAGVAKPLEVPVLDAPVSGGPFGAASGALSIMVGGPESALAVAAPIFEVLGSTVVHHGPSGAGQAAKLVNQLVVAATTKACGEAFGLASAEGLEVAKVVTSIMAGAAGAPLCDFILSKLANGDESPGFKIAHLVKDLGLAVAEAHRLGVTLPLTGLVHQAAVHTEATLGGNVGSQMLAIA
ncbi:2-hydroxy-3-oxopropionate reductase [Kribbella hippodromi]|uniref:2-hydroxy-3-oxopropionate reductase n=1 Tax=Kribbella hippodromi TaxID=434347 RepID=A0ABP4QA30_9ACTN